MKFLDQPVGEFLPETLRTALQTVEKDTSKYISDPQKNRVPWNQNDHAIYLGKWPRPGSDTASIYTDEVALALADYARSQSKEGPIKFVICPQLSQWFNGEDPEGTYLSPEEEKAHLEQLVSQKLSIPREKIIVQFGVRAPEHAILSENLEVWYSLKGSVELEDLFGTLKPSVETLNPNSPSLSFQIAGLLFLAAEKNPKLKAEFLKTVPGKLGETLDSEKGWGPAGYGLVEVAMRLADLIHGRPIQLGVDRQGVYDAIIAGLLLQAQKGQIFPELADLVPLLEGKVFRSIKLKTKDNYFEKKKKQTQARVRSGIGGLGLGMVLAGAYGVGHWQANQEEREQEHRLMGRIVNCASDLEFPLCEDGFCAGKYTSNPIKSFIDVTDRVAEEVQRRYQITPDFELRSELVDFLCVEADERAYDVTYAYLDRSRVLGLTDDFVQSRKASFLLDDIEVTRPYADLWEKRELLNVETELDQPEDPIYLGEFWGQSRITNHYRIWMDAKHQGVWAEMYPEEGSWWKPEFLQETELSKKKGLEAANEFSNLQHTFDAREAFRFFSANNAAVMNAQTWTTLGKDMSVDCMAQGQRFGMACTTTRKMEWVDEQDQSKYWFTIGGAEVFEGSYGDILLAKTESDPAYTVARATEAYERLREIEEASW